MRLTQPDHIAISAAIAKAEKLTSGEIYCIIANQASSYPMTPLIMGIISALMVPLLLTLGTWWHLPIATWLSPSFALEWQAGQTSSYQPNLPDALLSLAFLQTLAFTLAALATSWSRLQFLLTPKSVKRAHAHSLAVAQFLAQGLHLTKERTGVLIFVSVAERYAEVLADEGINRQIPQQVWQQSVDGLTQEIRLGNYRQGFITAIESYGLLLAKHFPPRKGQLNELPNRIIQI